MKVKREMVLLLANPNDETTNGIFLKDRNWYHLYITSDEEIKEGDWGIKTYGMPGTEEIVKYSYDMGNTVKKIIVSTDKSLVNIVYNIELGIDFQISCVAYIPQSFIEYYIEQYNKGNIITEVDVEYGSNGEWVCERKDIKKGITTISLPGRKCIKCSTWIDIEDDLECECELKPKINVKNEIGIEIDTLITLPSSKLEEMLVEFACKVYDKNYYTDKGFRKRSETMVNEYLKSKL